MLLLLLLLRLWGSTARRRAQQQPCCCRRGAAAAFTSTVSAGRESGQRMTNTVNVLCHGILSFQGAACHKLTCSKQAIEGQPSA